MQQVTMLIEVLPTTTAVKHDDGTNHTYQQGGQVGLRRQDEENTRDKHVQRSNDCIVSGYL